MPCINKQRRNEMKTIKYLLTGLLLGLFIIGCSGKGIEEVGDDTGQSFTIINSLNATFRIVDGQAGVPGEPLEILSIDGDGIHKGESQSFAVDSNKCDDNWRVVVYYNDTSRTDCATTKFVACGGSTSFVFNNTTCGGS